MKIAIIAQAEKRQIVGKLGGGIQAVEQAHARLLASAGHEVYFLVTDDSDDLFSGSSSGPFTVQIGGSSEEKLEADNVATTKQARGKLNRYRSSELESWIKINRIEFLINHSFSSSQLKMCVRLSTTLPVLTFLHCTPESASDMSLFAKLEGYSELTTNGSKLALVAPYQKDRWRQMLYRRLESNAQQFTHLQSRSRIDEIFDCVCTSQQALSTPAQIESSSDYFIVIGRPEADKNIGKLLDGLIKLKATGITIPVIKCFIAFVGQLDNYSYYQERMKDSLAKLPEIELLCNRPRTELLSTLSKAKALIVPTTIEAGPVAPIEALSYGVPTIAFCSKLNTGELHHSCFSMGAGNFYPVSVHKDDFIADLQCSLVNPKFDSLDERKRLAQLAQDRYSSSEMLRQLQYAIDVVSAKYKKTQTNNLSLLSFQ